MAIVRAKNPLRWVRRALLALGLASIAAVAVLLAAYRFGNAGRVDKEEVTQPTTHIDERTVTAGEGFDYTQTTEGKRVFRIRAARSRQDRADWAFLEEVHLEIYREDGQTISVNSRRARVNQQTWAAELEGDVVIRGWENLELRARGLELLDGGQQLMSVGAVEFHYPPPGQTANGAELALPALTGRASSLRIDRRSDTINLSGGVHIRNVPGAEIPLRVDCERLVYRRDEGLVRAFEDIFLQYGAQELQARALSLFMNVGAEPAGEAEPAAVTGERSQNRGLRMLRARWDVRGRLAAAGSLGQSGLRGAGGVEFEGQFLEVEPHADGLRRMRLEGDDTTPASVKVVDETGLARRLTGGLLESYAVDDQLQIVEGVGMPLLLEEFLDLDPPYYLRRACARKARARFLADGRLGRIDLEQQVELRDDTLYLSGGESAGLDLEHGTLEIQGPAVELFNERGALTAPRFSYSRDKGILHATAGVRALLKTNEAFAETPLGRGDEPVRIESAEATWTETPPTFSFRGGVRAWQGQNLLLADQLRGDESKQELAASGGVSTVWITAEPGRGPSEAGA
ncbi:MAG: LPS export ABC transporter periplasmic protein LptC, partial [Thermoanaerobaculia bacterium]